MIDPYFFIDNLKMQKKILKLKKLIGLCTQAEIDEIDKKIKKEEELKNLLGKVL